LGFFDGNHSGLCLWSGSFSWWGVGTRDEPILSNYLWNTESIWMGFGCLLDRFCFEVLLIHKLKWNKESIDSLKQMWIFIGFVNTLLSWKGFRPLSKLTFTAYLIHQDFIQVNNIGLSRMPFYYNKWNLAANYFVVLVASFMMAFFASIAIEMPFINLDRAFLIRSTINQSKWMSNTIIITEIIELYMYNKCRWK